MTRVTWGPLERERKVAPALLRRRRVFYTAQPPRCAQMRKDSTEGVGDTSSVMLSFFRNFAKSPWAIGLFVILMIAFVTFGNGMRDMFNRLGSASGDAVVTAGPRTVSSQQFKGMFDRYLKQLAQQNQGQPVTAADAVAQGLDTRILDEVASDESLNAYIAKSGVRPSDQLIADVLGKQQRFRDPVSGRFDDKAYKAFLRDQGVTAAEVEGELRDEAAQQQYITGLVAGLPAPRAYTALQAVYLGERRSFDYLVIPASAVGAPIKPTDADVQKFIDDNAARLTRPETRTVQLVRFSAGQLLPTVAADPAKVQKRYDFEKDSLSTPEKRTVVQIPLKSDAQAADVVARLKHGDDPNAVAKSIGAAAVTYPDSPQTAIPDRKLSDAAFAMTQGEVKGPVAGDLGAAVLKVVAVTPGHTVTLDEARPKIEAEVKKQAAADQIYDTMQKYEDARNGGKNLVDAAKAVGATVTELPAFTAKGIMMNGQPLPAPQKLVQTAFALNVGGDSETLLAAPGEYYAIHVEKQTPPTKLTVEEVRAPVVQQLVVQDLAKRLMAKGDEAAARVRKGEAVSAVATSMGASVGRGVDVGRDAAGKSYSAEFLGAMFTAKPGDVVTGRDIKLGYVVGKLTGVGVAPTPELASITEQSRVVARQNLVQDMLTATRVAARAAIKPTVDAKRAKSAIGVGDASPAQ